MSGACFFNDPIWRNPTINTPIPEPPRQIWFFFGPDRKISWWNFPRPRGIHMKPQYTLHWLDRTSVRTVLCSCLLLICHHFFYLLVYINPRLTKGGGLLQPPLTVFLRSLKNAKESYQGHLGNLFYILCGHFHEKKMGVPPYPGGRVSCQSQRVRGGWCNHFSFKKI